MILPTKLPQHFFHCSSHAAASLHLLLLLGAALTMAGSTARVHAGLMPCCNILQGVNLVPCLAMASSGASAAGGVANMSAACCSSLNQALDAGRRCLCSLLLANGVLAGLVATLMPTLPLVLPLPGCYLYAPPLASCQVLTVLQTMDALPAAAASAADPLPAQAAAVMPPSNKSSAAGKKSDGRTKGNAGNGSSEAREEERISRSHACQLAGVDEGGTSYMVMFAVVMSVFWFNYMAGWPGS